MPDAVYEVNAANYSGRKVIVRTSGKDVVDITWLCGGTYTWTKDGLREALENFERVNKVPDLIWKDTDRSSNTFYAKLVEDNFAADSRIFETATGVPWEEFKAAIMKAVGPAKKSRKRAAAKKK